MAVCPKHVYPSVEYVFPHGLLPQTFICSIIVYVPYLGCGFTRPFITRKLYAAPFKQVLTGCWVLCGRFGFIRVYTITIDLAVLSRLPCVCPLLPLRRETYCFTLKYTYRIFFVQFRLKTFAADGHILLKGYMLHVPNITVKNLFFDQVWFETWRHSLWLQITFQIDLDKT